MAKPLLWFRFYAEALNDPRVQSLEPQAFKAWVNFLCVASAREGLLPDMNTLAFAIRTSMDETEKMFHTLLEASLIAPVKNQHGHAYAIRNWAKRQFKSDSSTGRVKRFRNVTCNADVTPSEIRVQSSEQSRAEKNIKKVSDDEQFASFWKAYPNKVGKGAAGKLWQVLAPTKGVFDAIMAAVQVQKTWHTWTKNNGEFIPHPATWLNQRRWEDEGVQKMMAAPPKTKFY